MTLPMKWPITWHAMGWAGLALASVCTVGSALAAHNEAVRIVASQHQVELPPAIPGYSKTRRPPTLSPYSESRYMVETPTGLVQCTSHMVERASCEPSDFGRAVRWRTWVVKRGGQWLACSGPEAGAKCQPLIHVAKPGGSTFPPRQPSTRH